MLTTVTGMPGVSDSQSLNIVEASYIIELCKIVKSSHPARVPSLQLLELVFEDFEQEIFAEPREFDLLCSSLIIAVPILMKNT